MKTTKLDKNSLQEIGYKYTRDLEIDDKNHNFLTEDGFITSNSHSLAYSINAYISMWLKVHYPLEYFATLFNHSSLDDMTSIFKLAAEQGIKCNDFVANEVGEKFTVDYEKKTIKMGLSSVKGLPEKDIDKLLSVRLYTLDDLIKFTKEEKLGKKAIELLCRLQYFKNIHPNSKALENLLMKVKTSKAKVLEPDSLFPEIGSPKEMDMVNDYSASEKLKFELDYLGYYIHEHPFFIAKNIAKYFMEISPNDRLYSPTEVYNRIGNFSLYGIVTDMKLKKTKTGKDYFNLVIEDDIKQIQVKVWEPKDVLRLKTGNALLIEVESNKFGISKRRNGFILTDMVELYERLKNNQKENNQN
jgi:DNA polymerase-3 subunit alpha